MTITDILRNDNTLKTVAAMRRQTVLMIPSGDRERERETVVAMRRQAAVTTAAGPTQ